MYPTWHGRWLVIRLDGKYLMQPKNLQVRVGVVEAHLAAGALVVGVAQDGGSEEAKSCKRQFMLQSLGKIDFPKSLARSKKIDSIICKPSHQMKARLF